ncbi:MAG: dinitrogenase iron-molybdenum cofactor N-terminal domain-containing protein, partial [Chroococcales cyanobacterium]
MSSQPISNEVALRIALAARVLPNVSVRDLVEALQAYQGEDLTEESLSQITVTQLKSSFGNTDKVNGEWEAEDTDDSKITNLKEAVRILWGETGYDEESFPIESYQEGDLPNSIRVAVASNTAEKLDGHFGSCHRYLIYQLSADQIKLVDVRSALEADLAEDKNQFRVDLIRDCAILYVI